VLLIILQWIRLLQSDCMLIEVAAENRHCTIPLTGEPQHIVGGVGSGLASTVVVGCGTVSQPWSVEALAGQRIEVSLIAFSSSGWTVCFISIPTHLTVLSS
jgi:hypothetical protein